MNLVDALSEIPKSKFRLIRKNNVESSYFIIGEYNSKNVALARQIFNIKSKKLLNKDVNKITSNFYMVNSKKSIISYAQNSKQLRLNLK